MVLCFHIMWFLSLLRKTTYIFRNITVQHEEVDKIMIKGLLCRFAANEKKLENWELWLYSWRKIQHCSNAVTYSITACLASGESLAQVKEVLAVKLCDRGWTKFLKSSSKPQGFNLWENIQNIKNIKLLSSKIRIN